MEDAYCKLEGYTRFITKNDKRGTSFKAEIKRYKDEGEARWKEAKRNERKEVVHGSIIQFEI